MSHTNYTLALTDDWDIYVAADGSLATKTGIDEVCQNVANECRCFKGGLYYYQEHGIAWFEDQLGKKLDKALVESRIRNAALFVVGVGQIKNIRFEEYDSETRTYHGRIELITEGGESGTVDI